MTKVRKSNRTDGRGAHYRHGSDGKELGKTLGRLCMVNCALSSPAVSSSNGKGTINVISC